MSDQETIAELRAALAEAQYRAYVAGRERDEARGSLAEAQRKVAGDKPMITDEMVLAALTVWFDIRIKPRSWDDYYPDDMRAALAAALSARPGEYEPVEAARK